jgi:hypothetical protein
MLSPSRSAQDGEASTKSLREVAVDFVEAARIVGGQFFDAPAIRTDLQQ